MLLRRFAGNQEGPVLAVNRLHVHPLQRQCRSNPHQVRRFSRAHPEVARAFEQELVRITCLTEGAAVAADRHPSAVAMRRFERVRPGPLPCVVIRRRGGYPPITIRWQSSSGAKAQTAVSSSFQRLVVSCKDGRMGAAPRTKRCSDGARRTIFSVSIRSHSRPVSDELQT
jgi:hypothetical protein